MIGNALTAFGIAVYISLRCTLASRACVIPRFPLFGPSPPCETLCPSPAASHCEALNVLCFPSQDADDRIHVPRNSLRHRGSQRGHHSGEDGTGEPAQASSRLATAAADCGLFAADWSQQYTGLSDSDLSTSGRGTTSTYRMGRRNRSPDKDIVVGDFGDSDIESVVSVTSSAFSTQSERPRGSRGVRYTQLSTRHVLPAISSPQRSHVVLASRGGLAPSWAWLGPVVVSALPVLKPWFCLHRTLVSNMPTPGARGCSSQ